MASQRGIGCILDKASCSCLFFCTHRMEQKKEISCHGLLNLRALSVALTAQLCRRQHVLYCFSLPTLYLTMTTFQGRVVWLGEVCVRVGGEGRVGCHDRKAVPVGCLDCWGKKQQQIPFPHSTVFHRPREMSLYCLENEWLAWGMLLTAWQGRSGWQGSTR